MEQPESDLTEHHFLPRFFNWRLIQKYSDVSAETNQKGIIRKFMDILSN